VSPAGFNDRQDYAARIRNLPLMDGTEPVEEELKKRLEDATGQKVVGVSVPWLQTVPTIS